MDFGGEQKFADVNKLVILISIEQVGINHQHDFASELVGIGSCLASGQRVLRVNSPHHHHTTFTVIAKPSRSSYNLHQVPLGICEGHHLQGIGDFCFTMSKDLLNSIISYINRASSSASTANLALAAVCRSCHPRPSMIYFENKRC